MPTLTFAYLGDSLAVGDPLGCDSTGWPYRVESVSHDPDYVHTRVTLDPWPLLPARPTEEEQAAYRNAMRVASVALRSTTV